MKKYLFSLVELTALVLWLCFNVHGAEQIWLLCVIFTLLRGAVELKISVRAHHAKEWTVRLVREGPMPEWFQYSRLLVSLVLLAYYGEYWLMLSAGVARFPRRQVQPGATTA